MTIHVNYTTQEEKDASLAQERQQLAALQEQLNAADAERNASFADRQVARQELISAKAGVTMATQSGNAEAIASANALYASATANYDRAAGVHAANVDRADTLLDRLNNATDTLEQNTKAPIFEQLSPAAQAQAADTAEDAVDDKEGEDLDDDEKTNLNNTEEDGDENEPKLLNQEGEDNDENEREQQRILAKASSRIDAINHPPGVTAVNDVGEITITAKRERGAVPTYVPRDNPLHKYATYTYSIALYILTKDDINLLTTNPEEWKPGTGSKKTCLIASGGKNTGPYQRNENFTDDFYFDSLKMTTVIGLNNRSKSSNAVELSFSILEPYGMSLLDRIIAVANDIEAPNFKAMPYLLEVDFYGYDDTGKAIKIEDQRKRMPIQIIEIKIKSGTKGAEYTVKAIPWAHQALSQSAASTPINLEVKASTVAEFFYNNAADQVAVTATNNAKQTANSAAMRKQSELKAAEAEDVAARQKAAEEASIAEGVSPREASGYKVSAAARKPADQEEIDNNRGIVNRAFAVSSYCGGVNAWFTDLVLRKQRGTKDQIRIEFGAKPPDCPMDIGSTANKITIPNNKDLTRSASKEDKPVDAAAAAAKNANRVFTDASAFAVSAGTSILQVIDMVMRNSEYITSQVKDPQNTKPQELAEKEGKPLWWYKVVPSVEVGPYDYAMNKFSTITTYHILPYRVYDSKHPNGPSVAPQGSIKKYNYSYTGKNTDILDFQIDFDTLFYTAITAGSAKWESAQIAKAEQQKDDASKVASESQPAAAELVNRQMRIVSTLPQSAGAGGTQNGVKPVLAADIQKSQYSNSRGDMLNLKLKIIGDPELIKQDDIYTNPAQGGYADQSRSTGVMDNGSVVMDSGEILAQVEFKTIVDMDETTGVPRKDKYAENAVFTGLYRMLTVENTFQNGKFEQTIDMVRVPDSINSGSVDDKKGKVTTDSNALGAGTTDTTASGTRSIASDQDTANDFQGIEMASPPAVDPTTTEGYGVDEVGATPDESTLTESPPLSDDDLQLAAINESAPEVNIDDYRGQQSVDPEAPVPRSFFTSTIS